MFIHCTNYQSNDPVLLNTRYIYDMYQSCSKNGIPCVILITVQRTEKKTVSGRYRIQNETLESLQLKLALSQQMIN